MSPQPPPPRVVHPLPAAPDFLGRRAELAALRAFGQAGRGVLALVGLGGAGKTALAARFLAECGANGLFVWSFYQEPDAGYFLRELHAYCTHDPPSAARGTGLLHLLADALGAGGPYLLVLDGLERVQRQAGGGESYGQVEDPLLKGLLLRIAEGLGQTRALVTSRFPLTDLDPFEGRGYQSLAVAELDRPAALALLRQRGVRGDDAALTPLVDSYGAHALTLDHLGSLLGQFFNGDPARAPEAPALAAPGSDRQALRLARLLTAYETHLPPAELVLLCRLCLLRRSVTEGHLLDLLLCSPAVHARTVRELVAAVARRERSSKRSEGPEDLSRSLREALEEALCSAPLAGPEDAFRREICAAVEEALQGQEEDKTVEIEELAHHYAKAATSTMTEEHPLGAADRVRLRALYARYRELHQHPLLTFKDPDHLLTSAFQLMGWGPTGQPGKGEDLGPASVQRAYRRVRQQLGALAARHQVLRRVREVCRLHHRKWALAGPLATLDPAGLCRTLGALIGRHLVLREADGSYTAHPAVRDHFARLGSAAERGQWHDLLREQLGSLVQRPGLRHPEDRRTLDLVEEAIHHAGEAGRPGEALRLYQDVLGGLRHLGWKLGEMARGLRILRAFEPCPDHWALGWYLRALGELEEAYRCNDLPYFRADARLLQGRLPTVAGEGDDTRSAAAAFLMGQTTDLPPSVLGCAVPRGHVLLLLGRFQAVRDAARLDVLYRDLGWEGDRARCQLLAAEAARRQADLAGARNHLAEATAWVLHSGSVEHLCLLHLVRARLAQQEGQREAAQQAVNEGLRLARQCGLGLYHIDLLCLHAEIILGRGDAPAAERMANEALWRATATDCGYAWGEAEARHLLGEALAAQQKTAEARAALDLALGLRGRLNDPRAEETERLRDRLSG